VLRQKAKCHPEKNNVGGGLCSTCYHKKYTNPKKASCHPDKPHEARGLCHSCYEKLPLRRKKAIETQRRFRKNSRDKWLIIRKKYYNKNRDYILKREGLLGPGICDICSDQVKSLCRDHCHVTDKRRGNLCNSCNLVLGFAKDSPEILRKAALYLEKFQRNNELDPGRELVSRMDELLADQRAATEFHPIQRNGSDGGSTGEEVLGGSRCPQDLQSLKFVADRTFGLREIDGSSGSGDQESDNSSSEWTDQADGFGRKANERSSPS
jgi:Recombination endonuclease VII